MLHIVTPLYHYNLLQKVYKTIPNHADLTWHISTSVHREKIPFDFVYIDPRIKLYELDCADNDTVTKRNTIFNNIKDGYFFLLDDDTIFLDELYQLYQEVAASGFEGMVIGNQLHYGYPGGIKPAVYPAINPKITDIDSGMVLSHYSVLEKVRWEWSIEQRDFTFWYNCFIYFGEKNTKTVNKVFSAYNALGIIKIERTFLFIRFRCYITNFRMARWFISVRNVLRRLKIIKRK